MCVCVCASQTAGFCLDLSLGLVSFISLFGLQAIVLWLKHISHNSTNKLLELVGHHLRIAAQTQANRQDTDARGSDSACVCMHVCTCVCANVHDRNHDKWERQVVWNGRIPISRHVSLDFTVEFDLWLSAACAQRQHAVVAEVERNHVPALCVCRGWGRRKRRRKKRRKDSQKRSMGEMVETVKGPPEEWFNTHLLWKEALAIWLGRVCAKRHITHACHCHAIHARWVAHAVLAVKVTNPVENPINDGLLPVVVFCWWRR